ncbi:MAG: DNA-3-methyladenine glycosylase 2 family protein [Oscillospiraceae bacterium]|jgi:N-glycosylase/DNA lyase|nr:DNA-3-methyladenine glycosylase 2 family protein [Oscillospiraceae bacterium]
MRFRLDKGTAVKFDLERTLNCGQCFRWDFDGTNWNGVAFNREVSIQLDGDHVWAVCENYSDVQIWRDYFDFNTDYSKIIKNISEVHPFLARLAKIHGGIHILKQDPWEVLCSFIISQNNNIPRIKSIISRLCEAFGTKISRGYSFPGPERLANAGLEELRCLRAGFRAKYIIDASRKVAGAEIEFNTLSQLSVSEACRQLQIVNGVGPKVANCVMLYGLHRLDAFPIDVWIKRILNKYFPNKACDFFGPFAGVAQQYLYHEGRNSRTSLD